MGRGGKQWRESKTDGEGENVRASWRLAPSPLCHSLFHSVNFFFLLSLLTVALYLWVFFMSFRIATVFFYPGFFSPLFQFFCWTNWSSENQSFHSLWYFSLYKPHATNTFVCLFILLFVWLLHLMLFFFFFFSVSRITWKRNNRIRQTEQ